MIREVTIIGPKASEKEILSIRVFPKLAVMVVVREAPPERKQSSTQEKPVMAKARDPPFGGGPFRQNLPHRKRYDQYLRLEIELSEVLARPTAQPSLHHHEDIIVPRNRIRNPNRRQEIKSIITLVLIICVKGAVGGEALEKGERRPSRDGHVLVQVLLANEAFPVVAVYYESRIMLLEARKKDAMLGRT